MTDSEFRRRIAKIKEVVHQKKPDMSEYNSNLIRENTSCYSYAIGSTVPYLNLHRIGSISGKKPIEQEYFSIQEIKQLLFEDLKILDLEIDESSEKEEIDNDNQYKIALFVKIYADKKINDYHFLRMDNGEWTEKYRGMFPIKVGRDLKKIYNYWPWKLAGVFKITKREIG